MLADMDRKVFGGMFISSSMMYINWGHRSLEIIPVGKSMVFQNTIDLFHSVVIRSYRTITPAFIKPLPTLLYLYRPYSFDRVWVVLNNTS